MVGFVQEFVHLALQSDLKGKFGLRTGYLTWLGQFNGLVDQHNGLETTMVGACERCVCRRRTGTFVEL